MNLPNNFLQRMEHILGEGFPCYCRAMECPPGRSLRINTLKARCEDILPYLSDAPLQPNGIIPEGYIAPGDFAPGKNPYHAAGLIYMQEASAQMPVSLLSPNPGEWVLDLCAAPGGKSGQIAACLQGEGLIVSNEIIAGRATVLCRTLERLGVQNGVILNAHPAAVCSAMPETFDAVLVDAPCSGEGMFRKEPEAVTDWSIEHVLACANRQREILKSASLAVKPGGRLVYSTCTFSPEENEENVKWFTESFPEFHLVDEKHLYPHTCKGEGQYAALFIRQSEAASTLKTDVQRADKCDALRAFIQDTLTVVPGGAVRVLKDGRVFCVPKELPFGLSKLRVLSCGVEMGEVKNGRFLPSHSMFMAYPKDCFRRYEALEGDRLTAFLAGEEIPSSFPGSGYIAVGVADFSLGFGKLSNGTIKNHLPKGLRIR